MFVLDACAPSQFIAMVVLVAIHRHVLTGKMESVASALHRLIDCDLLARLPSAAFAEPNDFRRLHLYSASVNDTLAWHEPSLRNLFHALSYEPIVGAARVLDLRTWLRALSALGVIGHGAGVSEREATLCFGWSCMVADECHQSSSHGESYLSFDAFLEALCRLSVIAQLPTDEEIKASGCTHAGEYVSHKHGAETTTRRHNGDGGANARRRAFGEQQPRGEPVNRTLAHLLEMILFSVKIQTRSAKQDLQVMSDDMKRWVLKSGWAVLGQQTERKGWTGGRTAAEMNGYVNGDSKWRKWGGGGSTARGRSAGWGETP